MISFNQIPSGFRTPGVHVEVDNSHAVKGLSPWYQRILLIGQMLGAGTGSPSAGAGSALKDQLVLVPSAAKAQELFGPMSQLSRMVAAAKAANPYTEMWAIPLIDAAAGVPAAGDITVTGTATAAGTIHLYLGGRHIQTAVSVGDSAAAIATQMIADINAFEDLPCFASSGGSGIVDLTAANDGILGNDIDIRWNYHTGEELPAGISLAKTAFSSGSGEPLVANAITAMGDEQFDYIVWPFNASASMDVIEAELVRRFGPMVQLEGVAFTAVKDSVTDLTTYGAGSNRNCPHVSAIGYDDSPTPTEIWAAVYGATVAYYGNIDPARPFQTLALTGVMVPQEDSTSRWTREERNGLLNNGIATYKIGLSGEAQIERAITMYRKNASGVTDVSYLDVNTMLTLMYIRYQFRTRMLLRYPRHKLADDTTRVAPGQVVARPKDIRMEIIALFSDLEEVGVIENLEEFKKNLIVERNGTDVNRVDVLLPADLVNQFRILAAQVQFIL